MAASKLSQSHDDDEGGINDINITPFVDVVLVLLVIFMVTAPLMLKDQLKVNLPKTLTSDGDSKSVSIGIAITANGQVIFKGNILSDENLLTELKNIAKTAPQTQFLISADINTRHGEVVK